MSSNLLARRGFTLVEVMATVMLLAIVLPVVMYGMSVATNMASDTRRRSEAAALAETKLRELTLANTWQSSAPQGDFGADWPDYRWSFSTDAWDEANLTQLSVRVTWSARGQDRDLTLSTLIYSSSSGGPTQ